MKILIRGAGFQNKGAEAMLRTVQRELAKRLPKACFYVPVAIPEEQHATIAGFFPIVKNPSIPQKILRAAPLGLIAEKFLLTRRDPELSRISTISIATSREIANVGEIDGVIDISGYAYGASHETEPLKQAAAWIEHCQSLKKPFIFLPQAWGPFERPEIVHWARRICKGSTLFFSRDQESSKHLAQIMSVSSEEIRIAPDIALRFQGAPSKAGAAVLQNIGMELGTRPLVVIVPNMRVYERTSGHGANNEYVKILVAITEYCLEKWRVNVLLAPNEIRYPEAHKKDDRFLCGLIYSLVRSQEGCFILRENLPSDVVKSVIGQTDFLIASRFHSLVFALSLGVPAVALGWSHKYQELLQSFGLTEQVVAHDRLNKDEVLEMLEKAWQDRGKIKLQITNILPGIQAQVDTLFDEVASVIKRANP